LASAPYAIGRLVTGGEADVAIRVGSAVLMASVVAVCVWWLLRRVGVAWAVVGGSAGALWGASLALQNEANSETWALLPLTLSALVILTVAEGPDDTGWHEAAWMIGAGALAGLAALTKQTAATVVLLAPVTAVVYRRGWRGVLARTVQSALGFLAVLGGSLAWVGLSGDDPVAYLDAAWLGKGAYIEQAYVGDAGGWAVVLSRLWTVALPWLVPLALVLLIAIVAAWTARDRRGILASIGWVAVSAAGVAVSGRYYPHYWIVMLPATCVTMAMAGHAVSLEGTSWRKTLAGACAGLALIGALGGWLLDVASIEELDAPRSYARELAQRADRIAGEDRDVLVYGPPRTAAYVQSTLFSDVIWYWYGDLGTPGGSILLGREIPSRGDVALAEIAEERPDVVVVSVALNRRPEDGVDDLRIASHLAELLRDGYEAVYRGPGGVGIYVSTDDDRR
jgi:hypothetical protein